MLKKTITFKDLDDNELTEDFYFNISKAEIAKMELSFPEGGFAEELKRIAAPDPKTGRVNGKVVMDTFEDFIRKSVGRRSEDGRRFIKNDEITEDFMQSDAYSVFFMELVTDSEKGLAFVKAIFPEDLRGSMDDVELPTLPAAEAPAADIPTEGSREYYIQKLQDPEWEPNNKDLQQMDKDLMAQAFQRKNKG